MLGGQQRADDPDLARPVGVHDHRAQPVVAGEEGLVDEDLGEVGQLAVRQLTALRRGRDRGHGAVVREVAPAALRHPGRPAGGDHHGQVLGPGSAGQRAGVLCRRPLVEPQVDAGDRADRGHRRGDAGGQQLRRLREDHDEPRVELGDHPGAAVGVRRHRQEHRSGPDELRGVPHGQRLRPVRGEQCDEVAAADAEPVERPGVPAGRGEQARGGRVDAVAAQHGPLPRRLQRGDQVLDVDVHGFLPVRCCARRSRTPLQLRSTRCSAAVGPR